MPLFVSVNLGLKMKRMPKVCTSSILNSYVLLADHLIEECNDNEYGMETKLEPSFRIIKYFRLMESKGDERYRPTCTEAAQYIFECCEGSYVKNGVIRNHLLP